ncbi:GNAT family N-acetyltransferase [Halobacteria archaeon AArc-m2/3/4]|uniref:tRNA(Met) cytidine acetyltransferase TmcA n=1 Tax=Natronoglomus mannanivorans TaxID=2979990 RepID=A0AAP3E0A8_9EURY|nr:GNAT family N-acetyltransferase [Halobacteria archaeon AArc-xg1-1]MCU4971598.1 GNAT family N-acetyltransferase [Halobacteria archaeon AArc-m2/3/4]
MDVVSVATALFEEASTADERRLLVLAGDRERAYDALESILDSLPIPITETTLVGPTDRLRCEQLPQSNADRLLGTTRTAVALDATHELRPNALGSLVGTVDGGGLLILLAPPLETWSERRDEFDETLAVPPFSIDDVTGHFRARLVETMRIHRGIAIADLERDRLESDGLTEPAPRLPAGPVVRPEGHEFPAMAYDACYTQDQADALFAFESLVDPDSSSDSDSDLNPGPDSDPNPDPDSARAVVLEADRGRGKSSAAGLAAGSFAAAGEDVLVTAPSSRNAAEVFARATELLETLGVATAESERSRSNPKTIEVDDGDGGIRFATPADAAANATTADVVLVDEAAALPVSRLESLLAADRIAFATTIHGYEGAGRGFSVRFRDRLADSPHEVIDATLSEPIRYAAGDPVEVWAFRALLLDARPPVESLVADASPETATYRRLSSEELLADEHLLREAFGLLVLAHYRTEPSDLARLLDAPNLEARALCHDGHVVSVALLAREGNLSADYRADMYEGGRIRGNMIPDILTSQLRDEDAGRHEGLRVMRIATHHAVRSRGLGSRLLGCVHEEFADRVDWLGTGFGATPDLLAFWRANGYSTIHCSTTRNDASGEYSAIMLAPTSDAGATLHDRHARWFTRRFPAVCSDALTTLEPDVARELLRSVDARPELELTDHEWRVVSGAAYGPGLFDADPGPFRPLVVRYFCDWTAADSSETDIDRSAREERLFVLRVLQGRDWEFVADRLGYHSTSQCMRALGDALCPLVDEYGNEVALEERDRFLE